MTAATGRDLGRATPDDLRGTFLFEKLSDAQLARLIEHGRMRSYPEGVLYADDDPALEFFVLYDGTLTLSRRVSSGEVELVRTSQRGVYCGATQAYLGERAATSYGTTVRLLADSRFFVLPAAEFGAALREWFPMAMHLLEGLFLGLTNSQNVVGQRERLLALGQLSAGLMHELNNPAAAAGRAATSLRERVAGMRHKLGLLASGEIDGEQLGRLTSLQEATVERAATSAASSTALSPLEVSDREDELADWLDDHGIGGAVDVAPVFAAAGLDVDWADGVAASVDPSFLEPSLRWLAYTVETEALMREIEEASQRISKLIREVKQYSRMDRTPYESVDVREGLDSTLAILGHKIPQRVRVVRDYATDMPRVPGYGGELNQVWTNLIDNALGAMGDEGTLTVRAAATGATDGASGWGAAGQGVEVTIGDTGPGVPRDLQNRIFEPFFTTKPVGEGTGLGLDISYRIVVTRHRGDLRVESVPGDTRFVVRLPLLAPDGAVG